MIKTIVDLTKPILRPSGILSENDLSSIVIDYSYLSGPERKENRLLVEKGEYEKIVDRILNDEVLIEGIIKTWREYAEALRTKGKNAEPPIGSYHKRLMELCDPHDPDRSSILGTVFGEKIESDALYRYIEENSPEWSNEFSIRITGTK